VTTDEIRVLLADDDPMFSEIIRLQLTRAGFKVVAEAGTGEQAVYLVEQIRPDVALLDMVMPEMDGLDALRAIKHIRPQTSVVILTAHPRVTLIKKALLDGAGAFVTKQETALRQLPETIRTVLAGEDTVVELSLIREALKENARPISRVADNVDLGSLTKRERTVLGLIGQGMSNGAIAEELVLSENTVKSHVSKIYAKLKLSDRTQAALVALRHGLAA
jgi:DNA-binding NarL/FixJ family response regulator